MTIRRIPLNEPEPASELVPLDEAARRLNISLPTLRRWIKADLSDGKGRVPGARGEGSAYRITRATFERAMRDGVEPPRSPRVVAPDLDEVIAHLRRRAADDAALADTLAAARDAARKSA